MVWSVENRMFTANGTTLRDTDENYMITVITREAKETRLLCWHRPLKLYAGQPHERANVT